MSDTVLVAMSSARERLVTCHTRQEPRVKQLLTNYPSSYRKASVFIGLLYRDGSPWVLLTLRSPELKHHANTVSFPGGKMDAGDADEVQTALREAKEEVGLEPGNVEVVATLVPMFASPNFLTLPVVGFIKNDFEFHVNKCEVAEAFYLPLERFLQDERHSSEAITRTGSSTPYIVHRFKDTVNGRLMVTWGVTANFCSIVAAVVFQRKGFTSVSSLPVSPEDAFEHGVLNVQKRFQSANRHELAKM